MMKRILVLNLGSTSFKFKLYEMGEAQTLVASGGVESIGGPGAYSVSAYTERCEGTCLCSTHTEALTLCMDVLEKCGVRVRMNMLDAVGYKAVHGGTRSGACYVDDELIAEMERMSPWAPAHNPIYLAMMRSVREAYPELTQIACFETSFHATVPLARAVYGVPYEWMEAYGLRRYGFHGSSHSYIAWAMQQEAPQARRIISAHLGGSSSLCAILDGKSIATSMGATPQSGVFHNNRVGDLDAFALPPLAEKLGGLENAMKALSSASGFLGLSGISNDFRAVQAAADAGDARAEFAIAAFADAVVGYIGMYTAYLGGLDALVFTGGIGQNAIALRARIIAQLGFLQAKLASPDGSRNATGIISAPESGIAIWVLETNEELMVARSCARRLQA